MAIAPSLPLALRSKRYLAVLFTTLAAFVLFLYHGSPLLKRARIATPAEQRFVGNSVEAYQQHAYALVGGGARPTCTWQRFHNQRFAGFDDAPRNVFTAINFWNNEHVLPTFFQEFPAVVEKLGREHVYVSIYENGSEDKTPEMLQLCTSPRHISIYIPLMLSIVLYAVLGVVWSGRCRTRYAVSDMLTLMNVSHTVVSRGRNEYSHKENGHRINVLAALRNAAMEPLLSGTAARALGAPLDDVLWINDVFHCAADVLEVVYQRVVQGADQACAVDWAGWGDHVIYDRWVLRTMTGR
jgi:alpha-1,3-mannosyltransferase